MIRIELPFPPSSHGLFRNGRYKGDLSAGYKAWRDDAGYKLNRQQPGRFDGPVRIFIRLVAPDNRERDGDNFVKGIFDLLKRHGVITNDDRKVIISHYVEWVEDGPPCTVVIQAANDDAWEQIGDVVARVLAAASVDVRGAA